MMKDSIDRHPRTVGILIHVIGWGITLGFPFLMISHSGFNIDWKAYVGHGLIMPLSFLITFYVNYFLLIPRYLFRGKMKPYLILNLVLIALVVLGGHVWQEYLYGELIRKLTEGRPLRSAFSHSGSSAVSAEKARNFRPRRAFGASALQRQSLSFLAVSHGLQYPREQAFSRSAQASLFRFSMKAPAARYT